MARPYLLSVVLSPSERRLVDELARMDERSKSDTARRILLAEAERRGLKVAASEPKPAEVAA